MFRANQLQKALFTEIMRGMGDEQAVAQLVNRPEVVEDLLRQLKSELTALAGLGRAAVRNGRSDFNTMRLDFSVAMSGHPHKVLHWLHKYDCLRQLVSPDAVRGLTQEQLRANFQTLASLDEGL